LPFKIHTYFYALYCRIKDRPSTIEKILYLKNPLSLFLALIRPLFYRILLVKYNFFYLKIFYTFIRKNAITRKKGGVQLIQNLKNNKSTASFKSRDFLFFLRRLKGQDDWNGRQTDMVFGTRERAGRRTPIRKKM
jgi:hypothetical protein